MALVRAARLILFAALLAMYLGNRARAAIDHGEQRVSAMTDEAAGGGSRRELPFAQGRDFATLDEYLAFLRERGAIDIPWYREIGPGVYELVARRRPGAPAETRTRAELMERFGFSR